MASCNRKRRRILLATLAVVPLGLLAALAFVSPGTRLVAYSRAALIYQNIIAPWTIVEVPLPEGAGELNFYRKSDGMFQDGYNRRIEIRLERDHRVIASKLMGNSGGTMMFLHWQSADLTGGPYLWLQDRSGVTFANLGEHCLGDSFKPTSAISEQIQCGETGYPFSYNWRYLGRITDTDQGLKFLAEETWPPDVESKYVFASKRIPLPGTHWIFQIDYRPDPRGSGQPRYWITLTNPEGARITTWIDDDYQTSRCCIPEPVTLFWYPAIDYRGPYLRVGHIEGYGFSASTLIDLSVPRAYRAFRTSGMKLIHSDEGRVVTGMASIEDLWTSYAGFDPPAYHFVLRSYGAEKGRLPPLPDGVRNVTPQVIGNIDLMTLTFSPKTFMPSYLK